LPSSVGAGYAAITSGRVLNAKHSTAARSSRGTAKVWDRVAQAASSSSIAPNARHVPGALPPPQRPAFPPLNSSSGASSSTQAPGPAFRNPQHKTPWAGSGSGSGSSTPNSRPIVPFSVPGSTVPAARQQKGPPPKLNSSLFPELPSSTGTRQKPQIGGNQSLRKILGTSGAPPPSKWGPSSGSTPGTANEDVEENSMSSAVAEGNADSTPVASGGGKGKKGKGKQKQTLFTLGSFPT
jgi:E3 ubiquitin-protein ligase ZNF598